LGRPIVRFPHCDPYPSKRASNTSLETWYSVDSIIISPFVGFLTINFLSLRSASSQVHHLGANARFPTHNVRLCSHWPSSSPWATSSTHPHPRSHIPNCGNTAKDAQVHAGLLQDLGSFPRSRRAVDCPRGPKWP